MKQQLPHMGWVHNPCHPLQGWGDQVVQETKHECIGDWMGFQTWWWSGGELTITVYTSYSYLSFDNELCACPIFRVTSDPVLISFP